MTTATMRGGLMATEVLSGRKTSTRLLWLDLTRKCQLRCAHCYNGSGPAGGHGTMSRADWHGVLDQAAGGGVRNVQFIGGEPTMHPDFAELADHALNLGLGVEVFSNLVHVSARCWALFQRDRLSLATSYYSDRPPEHDAMTRRPSHRRTRANIGRAVRLGIPLRVGIITREGEAHVGSVRRDLEALGVTRIGVDHVRPFGRGGRGGRDLEPDLSELCGRCGDGAASVSPDGTVSPCVFSGFIDAGNVRTTPLADILGGPEMVRASAGIRDAVRESRGCYPDQAPCSPDNAPQQPCGPDSERECSPGHPGTECSPRN
ncbi:radical SAM/SPASM domain-containing protein [Streptomyces sp. CA-111067]|uniref:radical SAM/SPASM domain-containing protein n=1 Tax=Streptomyces sp. CA-111067 TaxID=3240046 RepID=UPI003D96B49F